MKREKDRGGRGGTHECDLKRLRQRMRVGGIEGEKERMMIERVMREREGERDRKSTKEVKGQQAEAKCITRSIFPFDLPPIFWR